MTTITANGNIATRSLGETIARVGDASLRFSLVLVLAITASNSHHGNIWLNFDFEFALVID